MQPSDTMSTLPLRRYSVEEYLAFERASAAKHEFYRGEVFAMTGGSFAHCEIISNIHFAFRLLLQTAPCRSYGSDLRIAVPAADLFTYPDLSILCGPPEFDPRDPDSIVSPRVIVEVLSPSTESYDRGRKFGFYRQIASLRAYLLVAQDEPRVELFSRQDDGGWLLTAVTGRESSVEIPALGCRLPLRDVFDNVVFPSPEAS